MKNHLVAFAVAASLAAPFAAQADTILYGSARVSLDYSDESNSLFNGDGSWDVFNNSSRLGVLGSEELGGGLSAIYQYEFGVDLTEGGNLESNRPKFVGLKGGFGQISLGTQETPYYHIASVTDIFNTDRSFGSTAFLGGSFNGFSLNTGADRDLGDGALVRLENSIYYTTPDMGGLSIEAMLVANGGSNSTQGRSNDIDLWNIAAKYSGGPFSAGVSYIHLNGNRITLTNGINVDLDVGQWIASLGYTGGPVSIGIIYEQGKLNEFGLLGSALDMRPLPPLGPLPSTPPISTGPQWIDFGNNDAKNIYLAGEYRFANNTIRAAYGRMDTGLNVLGSDETMDNYLIGYQYDFSKRTRLWVEYIGRSSDSVLYGDQNAVSIGTRVDF
jgi:predicted porin